MVLCLDLPDLGSFSWRRHLFLSFDTIGVETLALLQLKTYILTDRMKYLKSTRHVNYYNYVNFIDEETELRELK